MISSKDVFTALYDMFHRLETIEGPEDISISEAEIKEYIVSAQKDVESILLQGSQLLDKYVDGRIKKVISKMKYNGELK